MMTHSVTEVRVTGTGARATGTKKCPTLTNCKASRIPQVPDPRLVRHKRDQS